MLVGTMVGLLITANLLGVWQTWITSRVGNRVMGELRNALFDRLQSMELAFFTRTKTGVIQSRLQNDVGGVANVLSNTVSSVVGNTVTVIASLVTMLILSWQLTIVAVTLRQVDRPTMEIFENRVADNPNIVEAQRLFGSPDYLLKVIAEDLPAYQRFYAAELTSLPGVERLEVSPLPDTDVGALVRAFDAARALQEPKPRVIICDTKMAKGVPFLEAREKSHFIRVEQHEWAQALEALDAGRQA